ncbi:MAG: LamG domain-containing protein [bacterium]|nr:LamG domain-containing protein [bacterium]
MNRATHDILVDARGRSGGFVLLMVLMLIAASSVVGMSYIYGAQVKTASTNNLMLASKARYFAESGLEHGLYGLQTQALSFGSAAAPNGPYVLSSSSDGEYAFYTAATSTPNDYLISSTGTSEGISQSVSMTVRLSNDYATKLSELSPTYWWRLGDTGFTAVDKQAQHSGTYVNGVTRGAEGAVLGDLDTSAEFPGSNDYVNLSTMDALDADAITFGCWARADAWSSSLPRIISRASGTSSSSRLWGLAVSNKKIRFSARLGSTTKVVYGGTDISLGEWFFAVGTFDKSTKLLKVYLNGALDGTLSTSSVGLEDNNTDEVWIGDCPGALGTRSWTGAIDEVFIIKTKALTATEIKELYDARIPNTEVVSWDD